MTETALPRIGVVIIGINVGKYIDDCIRSVLNADYPPDMIDIAYVDGGSRDGSAEKARAYRGVTVIELNDPSPTPGKGRNAGWRALGCPLIQFLDADTIMHPAWIRDALPRMKDRVAAVCGRRGEKYPDRNIYHRIGSIEWTYEEGPCRYFGGDVLVRRNVLQETGGFDENLVAGEDPELSYRIRQKGWTIIRIRKEMTVHDLAMSTFRQYWKRAYRSGYAYAEIGLRFAENSEKLWLRELTRISVSAVVPGIFLMTSLFFGSPAAAAAGLILVFRHLLFIPRIRRNFRVSAGTAFFYALHLSFVVCPQFLGIVRYLAGRITGNPLRNKGVQTPSGKKPDAP